MLYINLVVNSSRYARLQPQNQVGISIIQSTNSIVFTAEFNNVRSSAYGIPNLFKNYMHTMEECRFPMCLRHIAVCAKLRYVAVFLSCTEDLIASAASAKSRKKFIPSISFMIFNLLI